MQTRHPERQGGFVFDLLVASGGDLETPATEIEGEDSRVAERETLAKGPVDEVRFFLAAKHAHRCAESATEPIGEFAAVRRVAQRRGAHREELLHLFALGDLAQRAGHRGTSQRDVLGDVLVFRDDRAETQHHLLPHHRSNRCVIADVGDEEMEGGASEV